jgi:hypothetical protein
VSVLPGNGDGTFQDASNIPVPNAPSEVTVADFNQDGIPDLAVSDEASNSVSVLLGNGDGTVQPPLNYLVGSVPLGITSVDFDSNGYPDIAVADIQGAKVSVLLNDGIWGPATVVSGLTHEPVALPGMSGQLDRPLSAPVVDPWQAVTRTPSQIGHGETAGDGGWIAGREGGTPGPVAILLGTGLEGQEL